MWLGTVTSEDYGISLKNHKFRVVIDEKVTYEQLLWVFNKLRTKKAANNAALKYFCVYSHSMVAGGFDVISYTTRLICFTSLTMRLETRSSTS